MTDHQTELYYSLKHESYHLAETVLGKTLPMAIQEGHKDLWDIIMKNSDSAEQSSFIQLLENHLSEKQRQILLDGLAQEYQDCDGWLAYVERECRE